MDGPLPGATDVLVILSQSADYRTGRCASPQLQPRYYVEAVIIVVEWTAKAAFHFPSPTD